MPDLPPPHPSASWAARLQSAAEAAGVERRHVALGAVTFVVLVIVAGGLALGVGRSSGHPEVTLPRAAHGGSASSTAGPANSTVSTGSSGSADAAGEPSVVAAAGAVVSPGLYRVAAGARVADVLNAAGGPTADADVDQLNLALKVSDGDRVFVPRKGETPAGAPGAGGGGVGSAAADGPVNLNTATLAQLDALPGVGPTTAQAILDYRRQHGRFRSVQDLLEVQGIGPSKLEKLRPKVKV
jgi:competence protein ComEA